MKSMMSIYFRVSKHPRTNYKKNAIIKKIITMVSLSLIIFNFLQVHKLVETHNALKINDAEKDKFN